MLTVNLTHCQAAGLATTGFLRNSAAQDDKLTGTKTLVLCSVIVCILKSSGLQDEKRDVSPRGPGCMSSVLQKSEPFCGSQNPQKRLLSGYI